MKCPQVIPLEPIPRFPSTHLGRLEGLWEAADVVLDRTLVAEELDVSTVDTDGTGLALGDVLLAAERGEAPVLGDNDLLPAWELVLGATEGLNGGGTVCKMNVR